MLINLHDAAVVSWEAGHKKPRTHEMHDTTRSGALMGAFWGFLFGFIFFLPFLGAAVGAATGALLGSLRDVGISDAKLIRTNLSDEQETKLREAFGLEE